MGAPGFTIVSSDDGFGADDEDDKQKSPFQVLTAEEGFGEPTDIPSSRPTADMPSSRASKPLTGDLGPRMQVEPKPVTEENKNANDPPTSDGWVSALSDAFRKMMPGSVLSEGVKNPAARAAALGFSHGLTMGADQNIPGYGEFVRDERQQARAEAPQAYNATDVAGMLANPVGALGKSLPAQMAAGGTQSGVRSFSDAPPGSDDAAITALKDAAVGAGATGVVGGAAKAAGGLLGGVANTARRQAWGVGAPEMEAYAQRTGLPINAAKRQFVQEGERVVPPNLLVPRDAGDWQVAGREATRGLNSQIEDTIDAAGAAGAQMPVDPRGQIANDLYHQAAQARYSGFDTARDAPLMNAAQAVGRGPQSVTPMDLRAQKIGFDRNAFAGAPGTPESLQGQANLAAGNQYRDMLGDYVAQGGPELAEQFGQQNNDFGVAATIRDASGRLGARNGPAADNGGNWMGRAINMVPGTGMVSDGLANIGRAGEGAAGWIAGAAPTAVTRMREQMMPDRRVDGEAAQSGAYSSPASRSFDQSQALNDSRGDQLVPRFKALLKARPELFSKYGYEIDQLAGEDQIGPWLEKQTRTDPQFARSIYPLLVNGQGNR